jgi:hypothetical protein
MGDVTILVTNSKYIYRMDHSKDLWNNSFERAQWPAQLQLIPYRTFSERLLCCLISEGMASISGRNFQAGS